MAVFVYLAVDTTVLGHDSFQDRDHTHHVCEVFGPDTRRVNGYTPHISTRLVLARHVGCFSYSGYNMCL